MTAQITTEIPQQNFELIRDQIGGVLLTEFLNQYTFNNDKDITPTTVDIERFVSIDDEEFPIINVTFINGKYDNKDYGGNVTGDYCYYISLYTGSASTADMGGDQIATLNIARMIGICRAILDNPIYATLGFDPLTSGMQIQNVRVEMIEIKNPTRNNNNIDVVEARMKFCVTVPETVPLLPSVAAEVGGTTVKLYNSDRFYFWGVGEPDV